jgi:hypothetical protein
LFFEPTEKHGGKKVLVGGRVEPPATYRETIIAEFGQEVGGEGARLVEGTLIEWQVKTDPYSDVRTGKKITLGKLCHGIFPEDLSQDALAAASELPVVGLYGVPDMVFSAEFEGTAAPKDGEAKRCVLEAPEEIRVTEDPADSAYAVGHELLVVAWHLDRLGLRKTSFADFADLSALRRNLVGWQRKFGVHVG